MSFRYVRAPSGAQLVLGGFSFVLFLLFEGQQGRVLGLEMFGLKTAVLGGFLVSAALNGPAEFSNFKDEMAMTKAVYSLIGLAVLAAPSPLVLQLVILMILAAQTVALAGILALNTLFPSPQMERAWIDDPQFARRALTLKIAAQLVLMTAFVWAMKSQPLLDWMIIFSFGMIAARLAHEWIVVLLMLSDLHGED